MSYIGLNFDFIIIKLYLVDDFVIVMLLVGWFIDIYVIF